MSDSAQPAAAAAPHGEHGHTNYVKIWAILLALLVVSVVGPLIAEALESSIGHNGRVLITLATAFGVAIVKASMVVKYFMHINLEKKYVGYLVLTMVGLMVVFFAGTAPDVLNHSGAQWQNVAAQDHVKKGLAAGVHHEGGGPEKAPEGKPPAAAPAPTPH